MNRDCTSFGRVFMFLCVLTEVKIKGGIFNLHNQDGRRGGLIFSTLKYPSKYYHSNFQVIKFKRENPSLGCRKIADHFGIGKTGVNNIMKNAKVLEREYQFFKGDRKKLRRGQFHEINEILYLWYSKCTQAHIYPDGPMLKEEAMHIKETLDNQEHAEFTASNGWLERFKSTYGLRETRLSGEGDEVPATTIEAWQERLPELIDSYELKDVWNMDETGVFLKALPEKGLTQKAKGARGGKKSKQRLTAAFFVAADGSKVCEPIVIWKSKVPRCFKNLKKKDRPCDVHYYASPKAWMTTEIMQDILQRLDRKCVLEGRKVLLFLDNAPSHPETIQSLLKNIKLRFFPKRTTSRLQPLDAGIIRCFKCKYRKHLLRHVVTRLDGQKIASDIIKEVDILKAIHWLQAAWKLVSAQTIANCFHKCGFPEAAINLAESAEVDEEFEELFKELTAGEDISMEEFITFDDNVPSGMGEIDINAIDWRVTVRIEAISEFQFAEGQQAHLDEEDEEDQEAEVEEMMAKDTVSATDALSGLDKAHRYAITKGDPQLEATVKEAIAKVESLQLFHMKQSAVTIFFECLTTYFLDNSSKIGLFDQNLVKSMKLLF